MNIPILSNSNKSGFLTSEFFRGVMLYVLAGYVIYKGYTPDQINDAISAVRTHIAEYQKMVTMIAALAFPMIDNLFYTKKRTELKKAGSAGAGHRET